jgi:thiol-disulfide isomerase/thioredoxin
LLATGAAYHDVDCRFLPDDPPRWMGFPFSPAVDVAFFGDSAKPRRPGKLATRPTIQVPFFAETIHTKRVLKRRVWSSFHFAGELALVHVTLSPAAKNRLRAIMPSKTVSACALLLVGLLAGCEVGIEEGPRDTAQAPAPADSPRDPTARQAQFTERQPTTNSPRVARGYLHFVEGYQQGFGQATAEGKPMLLFFTAEWCHFCHQMADEAFMHPQVVSLSEHFVCILVDADLEPEICRYFQVTGYPTIQFLSSRGVALERIVGKKPGHQLMMSMQAALQAVARRTDDTEEVPSR